MPKIYDDRAKDYINDRLLVPGARNLKEEGRFANRPSRNAATIHSGRYFTKRFPKEIQGADHSVPESEAHIERGRVEAQRHRWIFYETIKKGGWK
jgi:hypothetical protein